MRPFLAPPPRGAMSAPAPAPTFSVIVAAYEVSDVIGEALESVRRQTMQPFELIVCDDGSTDALGDALAPYADEIRLISKAHGGEASAKNAAAAAASGDFVVVLDADDIWRPERVEALAELASTRPDLDILTTDAYIVAGGQIVRRCYSAGWTFAANGQRKAILERNFVFGHAAVRRDVLLSHGGFDETILWTTDWDCWIRLILDGARVGCVDEPLAEYRVRETSLSSRRDELLRGKIMTLKKTQQHPGLTADERATVDGALTALERDLAYGHARAATQAAAGDARSRSRAIALSSLHRPATRLRAAAFWLAPRPAAWLIRRRDRRWWTGAGGTRVRRKPPA
jgi:GT2 family glycosyltransferase